jgi:hypothetical protein
MKKKQKKDKKAGKAKQKSLLGGFSKSGKKGGKKGGLGALTNGQKVAGGAALVAALGLGYWGAQRRRANAKTTGSPSAAGAEQQLASMQEEAA